MSLLRQGRYVLRVKETPLPARQQIALMCVYGGETSKIIARQQSRHPWLPPSRGPAAPSPADNGGGHVGVRWLLNRVEQLLLISISSGRGSIRRPANEALGGDCRGSIVAVVESAIFRFQIDQLPSHSKFRFIFF